MLGQFHDTWQKIQDVSAQKNQTRLNTKNREKCLIGGNPKIGLFRDIALTLRNGWGRMTPILYDIRSVTVRYVWLCIYRQRAPLVIIIDVKMELT